LVIEELRVRDYSSSFRGARIERPSPQQNIMASTTQFIGLAKSLPAPLQRFFARYPPAAILPENAPQTRYQEERPNPFRFYKHPVTGKWQDPVYSQRRQAELVKMARENGVEDLLPDTRKATEYQLAHRVEHGLRVKGTGVGQKVKGHIHERHMIAKYVGCLAVALATYGLCYALQWEVGKQWLTIPQDGDKEKGHAGDAQSHQALEEGKLYPTQTICITRFEPTLLTLLDRWANTDGPSSPNKQEDDRWNDYFRAPVHLPVYFYVQEYLQWSCQRLATDQLRLNFQL
jgi:large subunit ribosomal protein L25